MSEIQRADPQARRLTLFAVLGTILAGMVLIPLAETYLPRVAQWLTDDMRSLEARLAIGWAIFSILAGLPLLFMSSHLWQLGSRVLREERFPPAGARVVRDTPVLSGSPARRRGRVLRIIASLLAGAALALPVLLWRLGAPIVEAARQAI